MTHKHPTGELAYSAAMGETNNDYTLSPNTTNTQEINLAVDNKVNGELADSLKKERLKTDIRQINTVKPIFKQTNILSIRKHHEMARKLFRTTHLIPKDSQKWARNAQKQPRNQNEKSKMIQKAKNRTV